MTDFLLSPEGAKQVSIVVFGLVVAVYGLRFGLSSETRIGIRDWVRRHIGMAS